VLATAAATGVLVGGVAMALFYRELVAEASASNAERAAAIAAHVSGALDEGRTLLERVAAEAGRRGFDRATLDALLGGIVDFLPTFDSIYAYDRAGRVVIRRGPGGIAGDEGRARSLAEKGDPVFVDAAEAAMADGRSRLLPARVSGPGTLFIPCLVPVKDGTGQVVGLLSGAISTAGKGLAEAIRGLAPRAQGWIALIGPGQTLLARSGSAPGEVGRPFPLALPDPPGPGRIEAPGGELVAATAHLPEILLTVLVALPASEALAALPPALARLGLATLLGMVVAAGLAALLIDRLVARLSVVLAGIRALSEGKLAHRVPEEGSDELVELARSVNSLAGTLERTTLLDELWAEEARSSSLGPPTGAAPP
jgi:HAMP domain-containing protein